MDWLPRFTEARPRLATCTVDRRYVLSAAAAAVLSPSLLAVAALAPPEVEVFKSPYCGCCSAWVEHLQAADFAVKVTQVKDSAASRKRLGIADTYGSCHTATVGGYVLEGHVPAAEVKRLLATKPNALGLAVPGMPPSAPGMDVPGRRDRYDVLLVNKQGGHTVFARYPKS
jgi:hypothetical protein